ncbi:hypothetical protein M3Y99_00293900 [Aphelenchoides fujianensis]|nr:hypothetical protein M3Y99_00293900 [Aphelenchoides fujianensis]
MKSLLLLVALAVGRADAAAVSSSCTEWCAPFCLDACKSTQTTPICLTERECRCICPTVKAACKADWCAETCGKKADGRKFESKCDDEAAVCKCQFEAQFGPQALRAKEAAAAASSGKATSSNLVEQTFIADHTLRDREFKCTADWCEGYCTSKGNGRKQTAACDEQQNCRCKYQRVDGGFGLDGAKITKNVDLTAISNKTAAIHAANVFNTTKAECTPSWCSSYCETKADGRKFDAKCDSALSCTCSFAKQPLAVKDKNGAAMTSKKQCTTQFCEDFCSSKSNGRKFEAKCEADETCKCQYAWQPALHRVMSTASNVTA